MGNLNDHEIPMEVLRKDKSEDVKVAAFQKLMDEREFNKQDLEMIVSRIARQTDHR